MMAENNTYNLDKAQVFFDRAKKVAYTGNLDYAIELYLEGIRCVPDDVEVGHKPLRELALRRSVKGGKKPSMVEKMKYRGGKEPLEQMLNAEHLLSKDPDNLQYAEGLLKAAVSGEYKETVMWIADLIFQANNASEKKSLATYKLLKESYTAVGAFDRALAACQRAQQMKPNDAELMEEFQRLSAELAVKKGKYDQKGDFRNSIKDRKAQERLQSQQGVVRSDNFQLTAVDAARQALAEDPDLAKNIHHLTDLLSDTDKDESENEAVSILEQAHERLSDFQYKQKAGQIRMKQLKRHIRIVRSKLESNPEDTKNRQELSKLSRKLNQIELEHYKLCVDNYPTDSQVKYDYAGVLLRNKRYDEAIPLFQEAQHDPRLRIMALGRIGLCFFRKQWFSDAIDVFSQAIDLYDVKDDKTAKDLRYNLALAYEHQGNNEKALDIYRKLAQMDFGFKDVRQRVDKLRQNGS